MRTYKRTNKDGSVSTITTTASVPKLDSLYETLELYASRKCEFRDRGAVHRLAWFLGMNGETEACEALMRHKTGPFNYMYGP